MKRKKKVTRYCQLPSPGSIAGRSSSITNAFFNSIIPIHEPSEEEVLEALRLLAIDPENITCTYCGDKATEWDHLRPIITNQEPTGYITEIANLVPSCGKCNQSKGKRHWREWMLSSARLSPATRKVNDLDERVERLTLYSMWKPPTKIVFKAVVDAVLWEEHRSNWRTVLNLLQKSQELAKEIRASIEQAPRHYNEATGQVTYGLSVSKERSSAELGEFLDNEEVFARLRRSIEARAKQTDFA